jgi:YbbR domain-containing protein
VIRRLLWGALTHDAPLKAVAFGLAVALYGFVRGDRPSEAVVDVQVVYRLPEDRVLTSALADHLRVVVRGPWTRVATFDEHDLENPLTIDLSRTASGPFQFGADLVRTPPGVRVVSVRPAMMQLWFEPRVTRLLPVAVRTTGRTPNGYSVEKLTVTPEEVAVTGAQAAIEALREVPTAPMSLVGARGSFSRRLDLGALPRFVEYVDPHPVKVEGRVSSGTAAAGPSADPPP